MRFVVIGNGSMGKRRISHLKTLRAGTVFGYDVRKDRREEAESKFAIPTIKSVDELIKNNPDAVFICTPPAEHMFYIKLAIKNKWHFMCENPIWHRLQDADEICRSVKANHLIANVSCNLRFHKSIIKMREIIKSNLIGNVLSGWVEIGEWLPDWHPWEPYTDYYPAHSNRGGGLDSICDLDWIIDLFGKVERIACMADKKTGLDIDTNDIILMTLKFYNGPIINLHSDMVQRSYTHDAKFIGQEGTVIWRCSERAVYLYTVTNKKWSIFKEPYKRQGKEWAESMYLEDTRHFLKCLKGKAKPLNTIEDNMYALSIVLGALNSSKKNKFIYFK